MKTRSQAKILVALSLAIATFAVGVSQNRSNSAEPGPEFHQGIRLYEKALGENFDTASTGPEFDAALKAFEQVPRSDPKYTLAQTFVAEIKAGREMYAGDQAEIKRPPVRIYTRSRCGYCLRAVDWMNSHNVEFVEVDVGNNRAELRKLHEKAKANNLQLRGVPVFEIDSDLVEGFSASKLESSLKSRGYL